MNQTTRKVSENQLERAIRLLKDFNITMLADPEGEEITLTTHADGSGVVVYIAREGDRINLFKYDSPDELIQFLSVSNFRKMVMIASRAGNIRYNRLATQ
jgi:hypothetical protein